MYSDAMLRLYNTLTKKAEPLRPLSKKAVTVYSCGPTVYSYPHIGNMRKYLHDDFLVRALVRHGFTVRRIVNLTDVGHLTQDDFDTGEDKIVVAARKEGKSPLAIAEFYTSIFLDDSHKLRLAEPESYIRATDHIPEMQALAAKLIKKKHAYVSNGSVYFDVQSFAPYGQLSGNSIEQLKERVRGELKAEAFAEKKHPVDFALWIKAEPQHVLQWPSPWGAGYPGWHIECAAMILKHLGNTIDIHTGGEDHIFPHHEDEIAEAQAATGKPLANIWMHVRHLLFNQGKMAKRTGTFIRVADLEERGFSPLAFRYLVLSTHYRARMNFTWPAIEAAQEGWQRYVDVIRRLRERQASFGGESSKSTGTEQATPAELKTRLARIAKEFDAALADDLATPRALVALSEFIGVANTYLNGTNTFGLINSLLEQALSFEEFLALLPEVSTPLDKAQEKKLHDLLTGREEARTQKRFAQADQIRRDIEQLGYDLQDTPSGVRWVKRDSGQHGIFAPKRG